MKNLTIGRIKVTICENYEEMSRACAEHIAQKITEKKNAVIGFATGGSPMGTYKALVEKYHKAQLDFGKITTLNLDEYYPIACDNDQSYHYYMDANLFSHVNVMRENINFPEVLDGDPAAGAAAYEKLIMEKGPIDLQILGIGENGHIGFCEPDLSFQDTAKLVELAPSTRQANARFFASLDEVPTHAITMGIGTIMSAKELVMVVNGEKKAEILAKALTGPITPSIPASAIRFHQNVTIYADKLAARILME